MGQQRVTRVEVYEDDIGEARWRAKAANGETLYDSSEGYVSRSYAAKQARDLHPDADIVYLDDRP